MAGEQKESTEDQSGNDASLFNTEKAKTMPKLFDLFKKEWQPFLQQQLATTSDNAAYGAITETINKGKQHALNFRFRIPNSIAFRCYILSPHDIMLQPNHCYTTVTFCLATT